MDNDDERLLNALAGALASDQSPSEEQVSEFRRRVAERMAAQPVDHSMIPPARRGWWIAAVAAAVLAVGLLAVLRPDGAVEYEGIMTAPGGDTTAEVTVVALGIGRQIDLVTDELAILPIDEFYELWFVAPDDSPTTPNRISAGTFHPDSEGRSDVQFVAAVDPRLYPGVEITAEPGDGDPAATGPVVLETEIPPP